MPRRSREPPQEPSHVHIEEWLGSPVHNGQNRTRRVGADTSQALQLRTCTGNDAPVRHDRLCETLKRQHFLPPEPERPEHALETLQWGLREGSPRWEVLDESGVGPCDPDGGGPLQQDFRDNDLVRGPVRLAPEEGAAALLEPGEEPPAQPADTLTYLRSKLIGDTSWLSPHPLSFLNWNPPHHRDR